MRSSSNGNNYLPRSPSNTLPYFIARSCLRGSGLLNRIENSHMYQSTIQSYLISQGSIKSHNTYVFATIGSRKPCMLRSSTHAPPAKEPPRSLNTQHTSHTSTTHPLLNAQKNLKISPIPNRNHVPTTLPHDVERPALRQSPAPIALARVLCG
jgi:hypothetical protein